MRVPTITATAGYAAYLNEHYFDGLQSTTTAAASATTIERNKNNGNIDLLSSQQQQQNQTQLSSQHTNEFISSADEFVQRALSSAPTNSYKVESNFEFSRACSENKNFNINSDIKQSPAEHEDADQYNTYRSFKDAFNVNRIFYEECARNFDGLHAQDPQDIDPILIINSPCPVDDITDKHSTSAFGNMKIGTEAEEENTKNIEVYAVEAYSKDNDDNDYDDHAMLDLCSEQNDDDVKEFIDRDAYLTSPTSSSISDHTPKRTFSYFPRGIINPNYPGFQHLAHTLTEHFITGTSASDSYDSDISEYEMELSADSFEDLTEEATEQLKLKLNRFNNNFTDQQISNTMHPDDLLDVEFRERHEQKTHDVYDDAFISESVEKVMQTKPYGDDNCNVDLQDLPSSLRTTLTLLEPANHLESPAKPDFSDTKTKYGAVPPDILMKDDKIFLHVNVPPIVKEKNRPDLLYGVSPQHLGNRPRKNVEEKQNLLRASAQLPFEMPLKDEISLGVTPVDIIGDFGQEVEREFGLLVSGYRRLMDMPAELTDRTGNEQNESISKPKERLIDAELSNANDEIDTKKYLAALNQFNQFKVSPIKLVKKNSNSSLNKTTSPSTTCDFIEDNNAVDWSCSPDADDDTINEKPHNTTPMDSNSGTNEGTPSIFINEVLEDSQMEFESKSADCAESIKPKYQKSSYDERQLPPVAIEYKRCQQHQRNVRKSQQSEIKTTKTTKKSSFTNRLLHGKRSVFRSNEKPESNIRKREEAEIHQYQQLISDKELILSNSRYTKLSTWAQYLKNSVKDKSAKNSSTELISPSALELFDAYKVGGEVDRETLQKHLKMAKEIEKKRRSDREEIRRRLAMGGEENSNSLQIRTMQKPSLQSVLHNGLYICRFNDISSDTESHSSDSETCPKLSKIRQQNQFEAPSTSANVGELTTTKTILTSSTTAATHPYHGRPLSVSCTNKELQQQQQQKLKQHKDKQKEFLRTHQQQQQNQHDLLPITDEDRECDFFTKQARLQIEARMALSQAKEMAHMQMEVERQNRRMSPITGIIRNSLDKIGVQMTIEKRRVSRQMLTDMNIAQLQILVNSLHTHIEDLNESLVQFLMERDDLHVGQDAMLVDIEELTRYIGAQEHLTNEHKKAAKCNRSK